MKCFNFAPSEDDETATSDAIPGARRRWISFFVAQLSEVRGQFRAFLLWETEISFREKFPRALFKFNTCKVFLYLGGSGFGSYLFMGKFSVREVRTGAFLVLIQIRTAAEQI